MEIQNDKNIEAIPVVTKNINIKENEQNDLITTAEIQAWLIYYLADLLEIQIEEIDVTVPFDRYGLDSSSVIGMVGDLEIWMGCEIDPTLVYDYSNIKSLSEYLPTQCVKK